MSFVCTRYWSSQASTERQQQQQQPRPRSGKQKQWMALCSTLWPHSVLDSRISIYFVDVNSNGCLITPQTHNTRHALKFQFCSTCAHFIPNSNCSAEDHVQNSNTFSDRTECGIDVRSELRSWSPADRLNSLFLLILNLNFYLYFLSISRFATMSFQCLLSDVSKSLSPHARAQ